MALLVSENVFREQICNDLYNMGINFHATTALHNQSQQRPLLVSCNLQVNSSQPSGREKRQTYQRSKFKLDHQGEIDHQNRTKSKSKSREVSIIFHHVSHLPKAIINDHLFTPKPQITTSLRQCGATMKCLGEEGH